MAVLAQHSASLFPPINIGGVEFAGWTGKKLPGKRRVSLLCLGSREGFVSRRILT